MNTKTLQNLNIEINKITLVPIDTNEFDKSNTITDCIIYINKTVHFLNILRTTAVTKSKTYILKDNLLLYWGTFIIPNINYLYINLIWKTYNQISTTHFNRNKTYQFLYFCYYWPEMRSYIIHFVCNCHICRHADVPRDKTPSFLYPLLIPDKPWQYITINFKSFFIDKNEFDNVYIVIDHLSKQIISISYQKTVSAKEIARLYIAFIYRYHKAPESIISNKKL